MQSILLRCEPADQDELIGELWQHGTLGIIEEAAGLRAFFQGTDDLGDVFAERILETRDEQPFNPADFPKQDWEPLPVGERFWIAPSWVDAPVPPDRIRLAMDNPNAFGSGRHETTQLALEALEQYVTAHGTVLDIGSGSGILSRAAAALGARRVFSCDIHEDAINSSRPQLAPRLFLGSADAIRTHTADVVVANITARILDALAWELNRIIKPDGVLILTGFLRERLPSAFHPEKTFERGDWLCWICRPQTISAESAPKSQNHSLEWW